MVVAVENKAEEGTIDWKQVFILVGDSIDEAEGVLLGDWIRLKGYNGVDKL
jgi:hypothetical protein